MDNHTMSNRRVFLGTASILALFYEFFTSGITHLIRVFQNRTLDGLDQIPDPFVGRNGELDIQIDRPPIEEHHRHNQHHQQMVIQPARVTRQNRVQQNIRLVREILADRNEFFGNWMRQRECGAGDAPTIQPVVLYLLGRQI